MGNNEKFGILIHHGGHFDDCMGKKIYVGGTTVGRYDLDPDTFGYFDVEDLVEKVGYISWSKLLYQIPKCDFYRVLKTDKEVMEMLAFLSHNCRMLHIYVDGRVRQQRWVIGGCNKGDVGKEVLGQEESYDINEKSDGSSNGVAHDLDADKDWGSEEDDLDYEPSEDETSYENLDDLELSDEDDEYIESKRSHNIFEMIDNYMTFGIEKNDEADNDSEYESSDGNINSSETDEEGDVVRPKQKRFIYDPNCIHKDLDIKLGLRFQYGYECRDALKSWAIENGWFIRFKRVSKTQCEAKCKPPCTWRVYASIIQAEQSFVIKSYSGDHKCCIAMNNNLLSSNWIAKRYVNIFRVRPNLSIVDLKADIMHRFSTDVSKDRLYRARSIARKLVTGSVEEHYAMLGRYIAELRRVDKDGRYELLLGEGNVFKRLYIGLSSLRKGFKLSCRPVIGLDGCFLKTYLGEILMCVVGRDGNNQMFPISWAVVEIENEDCWTWFLKCLLEDLGITNGDGWTFISDQQKHFPTDSRPRPPPLHGRSPPLRPNIFFTETLLPESPLPAAYSPADSSPAGRPIAPMPWSSLPPAPSSPDSRVGPPPSFLFHS